MGPFPLKDDVAISVENLGKRYQLGVTHAGSVRELVSRGLNRLTRGKGAPPQPDAGHSDPSEKNQSADQPRDGNC